MRTIAILNLKGGTGKSVTTATMARALAAYRKKRVICADMDPQGHLTQYFDISPEDGCTTYSLLTGQHEHFYLDFVTNTHEEGIDIIPANIDLARLDLMGGCVYLAAVNDLRMALEEDGAYDFFLMDCHPGFGKSTQAALYAADEVLIPVRLDMFSASGMAELVTQVNDMRRLNPRLRVAGVLATQYMGTEEEQEAHSLLQQMCPFPVFKTRIRMSRPVLRSINRHESLFVTSPTCGAARDYRAFMAEYLKGGAGA